MMPTRLVCPADRQIRLSCEGRYGVHEVVIAPGAGGRILRLSSQLAAGHHDWLVPVDVTQWPADAWPKGGVFPLVPFSNRVRDGVFGWAGQTIELDRYPGQTHALHGFAQEAIWSVTDQAAGHLVMEMRHPAGARGWLWSWQARQVVRLHAGGLSLAMEVTNLSDTSMPLGCGFHPYFTAQSVSLNAATRWVHEQELALYPEINTHRVWDKGTETWTEFLSDWDGRCVIHWKNGLQLNMDTRGTMSHVVLHGLMGRYLCVEPVSHVCDAFNLAANGHAGTGIQVLPPGRSARVVLELSW